MTIDALEAESCVIGAILLDAACLPEVAELLSGEDFALETNRRLFRAALALDRRGEPVDPATLRAETRGEISDAYMLELMDRTATAANAAQYARLTRQASMRRGLRALADTIAEKTQMMEPPRDVIAAAQRELERIEAQDAARELATSEEMMLAFYEHRALVDKGGRGFVPTGFRPLDRLLGGGLLNSGLYVLAARPGMGKTTFALNVAEHVAKDGPVLFVSLEMDLEQIAAKRLGRAAGISSSALMMGTLTEEERGRAAEHAARLAKATLTANRMSDATVDDIAHMARKEKGLRLVVIDYFGLIKTSEKRASRYEAMTDISGQLKALARALHVPVLCLAQLNRENMRRTDNRPKLSDLRDTGALEQDADGVIFLHRPDYYGDESPDPWAPAPMQIILEKNRHAGTGICDAAFYMAVGRVIPAR